jgi:hypothetical protein
VGYIIAHGSFLNDKYLPSTEQDILILEPLIDKYTIDFVVAFFGYDASNGNMVSDLITHILQATALVSTGDSFIDSQGRQNHITGLNKSDFNPLLNYVYYKIFEMNYIQASGLGLITSNTESGQIIDPKPKLVRVWNEMVDYLTTYHDYMKITGAVSFGFPNYPGLTQPIIINPTTNQLSRLTPFQKLFVKRSLISM